MYTKKFVYKILLFSSFAFLIFINSAYAECSVHFSECGDVNGSGDITAVDALMVLQKAVGKEVDGFVCSCPNVGSTTSSTIPTTSTTFSTTSTSSSTSSTTSTTTLPPIATAKVRYQDWYGCPAGDFLGESTLFATNYSWTASLGMISPWETVPVSNFGPFLITQDHCPDFTWDKIYNLIPNCNYLMYYGTTPSGGIMEIIPDPFDSGSDFISCLIIE